MNCRNNKGQCALIAFFIATGFYMIILHSTISFLFLAQQEAAAQLIPQQQRQDPAVEIPVSKGYVDGKIAYFIATDASDAQAVQSITNNTQFPINYAPILTETPESGRGQGYLFLNGVKGEGSNGFQLPVANAVPGDSDYSPIWESNFVKWNDNATARELKSAEEILFAQNNNELQITKTNTLINSPAVHQQ